MLSNDMCALLEELKNVLENKVTIDGGSTTYGLDAKTKVGKSQTRRLLIHLEKMGLVSVVPQHGTYRYFITEGGIAKLNEIEMGEQIPIFSTSVLV